MERPSVSVIVPVYNDPRVADCVAALTAQTYPSDRVQIVVVDNGSAIDPAPALARWPQVRLVREERVGSFAARNRGIAASDGEVLAFTDADCMPLPTWIEEGVAALQGQPGCGLVGGRIDLWRRPAGPRTRAELFDRTCNLRQSFYVEVRRFAATANLFTWRRVVDAVGPFRAELRSGGDLEWGGRVAARGYPLVYADRACVRHAVRTSWRELVRKERRTAGGHVSVLQLSGARAPLRHALARELRYLIPARVSAVLRSPAGALDRTALCLAIVMLSAVRAGESLRVCAGGEPRRA